MKNRYQQMISELTEKELLFHLYATQVIMLIVSMIIGGFIYRNLGFIGHFFYWNDSNIFKLGVIGGLLVVVLDLSFMKVLPKSFYDDGGLNEKIFVNRNVFHIAFIALIVAFSEELLFRGIIQNQLGLIFTSLVFALIHYRYLFNKFLFFNILALSFIIGYIYEITGNLSVTFVMHFIIDFLLGYFLMINNKRSSKKGSDFRE